MTDPLSIAETWAREQALPTATENWAPYREMSAIDFERAAVDYGVPEHTAGALARYVFHRIPPGGFLTAVLSNDALDAYGRADAENAAAMPNILRFLASKMPSGAYGSRSAVCAWLGSEVDP